MDRRLDDVPEAIRKFVPKDRQQQREAAPEPQREAPPRAREQDDPTDAAGQALLAMLQQAARVADENRENALSVADRLAAELRAVEDRMLQLEAAVAHYKNRAEHAEHWLQQIQREIEQKLIGPATRGNPPH
jgi:cell division septum initiation protein DivIVA